jgi:lysophospholipase L1-like esterase
LSKEGVNPDMVFVYLGVNDISRGSTVLKDGVDYTTQAFYDMIPGLYTEYNEKYSANTADYGMNLSISLGLDTYARAYAYILYSIKHNYPNAEIVCLNVPEINSRAKEYNDVVSVVAEYYGAIVVDNNGAFKSAGGSYASHTYDNSLHPDKEGFDIMSNAVIAKMNEIYGN